MNYRACGCYCIKCNFCGKSVGIERTEFNYGSVVECDRAGSYVICCADAVVKDSLGESNGRGPRESEVSLGFVVCNPLMQKEFFSADDTVSYLFSGVIVVVVCGGVDFVSGFDEVCCG